MQLHSVVLQWHIFNKDNEDDNNMALPHSVSEELEDLSRGPFYDKTAFVEANGTPENKVCIITVANLKVLASYILSITGQWFSQFGRSFR